jgi:hypothetical protein
VRDVLAVEADRAAVGRNEPEQDLREQALARARLADPERNSARGMSRSIDARIGRSPNDFARPRTS